MRASLFVVVLAAVTAATPHCSAAPADAVPKFDIVRHCQVETGEASDKSAAVDQCVADEKQARDRLTQQWGRFAREDKSTCVQETGIADMSSYSELETCLEIAAEVRTARK